MKLSEELRHDVICLDTAALKKLKAVIEVELLLRAARERNPRQQQQMQPH